MTAAPVVDPEQLAWIQSGVATIVVSSHSPNLVPSITLGLGCSTGSLSGQGTQERQNEPSLALRVYVLEAKGHQLLRDVRGGGAVSVLFVEGSTHKSLQIKARRAREVARTARDVAAVDEYTQKLIADLLNVGESEPYLRALLNRGTDALVVLEIEPTDAFDQTPGPAAGTRLGGVE